MAILASRYSTNGLPRDFDLPVIQKVLFGRFMLPGKSEHSCSLIRFCLDGAYIKSDGIPSAGDAMVLYVEHFGRMEGVACEPAGGGFEVRFVMTDDRKAKLDTKFSWLLQNEAGEVDNERQYNRRQLSNALSRLRLFDGREIACEVTDVSMTGAAVAFEGATDVGERFIWARSCAMSSARPKPAWACISSRAMAAT